MCGSPLTALSSPIGDMAMPGFVKLVMPLRKHLGEDLGFVEEGVVRRRFLNALGRVGRVSWNCDWRITISGRFLFAGLLETFSRSFAGSFVLRFDGSVVGNAITDSLNSEAEALQRCQNSCIGHRPVGHMRVFQH